MADLFSPRGRRLQKIICHPKNALAFTVLIIDGSAVFDKGCPFGWLQKPCSRNRVTKQNSENCLFALF